MRVALLILIAALACVFTARAVEPLQVNMDAVMAQRPPQTLAEYGFFGDPGAREPNPALTPYDLNTALYSDGALKFRYVFVPPGARAQYNERDVFTFPVGTVLIKTFAFAADMRAPTENIRFIETRLLIHRPDGWVALPYVWNEAQTEARLSLVGATVPTRFIDEDGAETAIAWAVPNRNQCKGCHDRSGDITPIGPSARNLNRDGQLALWHERGVLDLAPADAPRVPNAYDAASGSVAERARAYLDVNCAHCHNPNGPGNTSGLDLRWGDRAPIAFGVRKRPTAAGRGSAGMEFAIDPGHPDRSYLVHRMESTDPGTMMPELGRTLVDERAITLMREWIAEMEE